jgi:hypothetical protein
MVWYSMGMGMVGPCPFGVTQMTYLCNSDASMIRLSSDITASPTYTVESSIVRMHNMRYSEE